jgi:hypothetical protein
MPMKVLEKFDLFITEICSNGVSIIDKNNIAKVKKMLIFLVSFYFLVEERINFKIPAEDYQYDSIGSLTLDWSSSTNEPDEEYFGVGLSC